MVCVNLLKILRPRDTCASVLFGCQLTGNDALALFIRDQFKLLFIICFYVKEKHKISDLNRLTCSS